MDDFTEQRALHLHPALNMEDVLDRVRAAPHLKKYERENLIWALNRLPSIAQVLSLSLIPAQVATVNDLLNHSGPGALGISQNSWTNLRSLLRKSLALAGLKVLPGRHPQPWRSRGAWRALLARLPERIRLRVSRFCSYCDSRGFTPPDVNDELANRYADDITKAALIQNPKGRIQVTRRAWNEAADLVPDLNLCRLTVPNYSKKYCLEWDKFGPDFKPDVEACLSYLGDDDVFMERDFDPLAPSSIDRIRHLLLSSASVLALSGRAPATINSVADLVDELAFKAILKQFLARGCAKHYVFYVSRQLCTLGRRWVKIDDAHYANLRKLRKKLRAKMPKRAGAGMSEKNKTRLRPFKNRAVRGKLLLLPGQLFNEAEAAAVPSYRDSLKAQTGIMFDVLAFTSPIRVGNLCRLETIRHIPRSRGAAHLFIPGEEVKNGEEVDVPIRPAVLKRLDIYITKYRPILTRGHESTFLFPGKEPGTHKAKNTVQFQISDTIFRRLGLPVHAHLFRHIGALIYLISHPGDYRSVARILGDRSVQTVIDFYTGLETDEAFQRLDNAVEAELEQAREDQGTPRKRVEK